MHEIVLPETIKVGGFDYPILINDEVNRALEDNRWRGEHSDLWKNIKILSRLDPQSFSATFIHEVLHAINSVYLDSDLREYQIAAISNGFHQVLEQLGVRFIKRKVNSRTITVLSKKSYVNQD